MDLFVIGLLFDCSKPCGDTETVPVRTVNRQCSSGLQAVADVAAAIKAGFYDIGKKKPVFLMVFHPLFIKCHIVFLLITTFNVGIGAGLESMTTNPMAWEGSVNPRVLCVSFFLCVFICLSFCH